LAFPSQKVSFSALKLEHIERLGVRQKILDINSNKLAIRVAAMPKETKDEITRLKEHLLELYGRVTMQVSRVGLSFEHV
jgi:hypothetical protein